MLLLEEHLEIFFDFDLVDWIEPFDDIEEATYSIDLCSF